jgi:hypothetical protein
MSGNAELKLRIVQDELNNIPGPKNQMDGKVMICCPYHADGSPSMSVQMDVHERNAPLGWAYCFGCKKSVPWNSLATTLNLKKFGKKENLTSEDFSDPSTMKDSFLGTALGDHEDEEVKDTDRFPDLKEYKFKDFPFEEWRDVQVSLLEKVGARLMKHKHFGTHYVFLPVYVKKVLRGYVRAQLVKPENGKPSYLNAKGGWSRKWGLLYFDYAVRLMKKKGLHTMVLCEGPRDSLRFLKRGIPAVSVLGALNWGADKRGLLEDAGVKKLILAFDGDKAGWRACRKIYTDARKFFNTKYLALWKYSSAWDPVKKKFPSEATIKKMKKAGTLTGEADPFSCDIKFIKLIESNLE